jgi:hypothetical protein
MKNQFNYFILMFLENKNHLIFKWYFIFIFRDLIRMSNIRNPTRKIFIIAWNNPIIARSPINTSNLLWMFFYIINELKPISWVYILILIKYISKMIIFSINSFLIMRINFLYRPNKNLTFFAYSCKFIAIIIKFTEPYLLFMSS